MTFLQMLLVTVIWKGRGYYHLGTIRTIKLFNIFVIPIYEMVFKDANKQSLLRQMVGWNKLYTTLVK